MPLQRENCSKLRISLSLSLCPSDRPNELDHDRAPPRVDDDENDDGGGDGDDCIVDGSEMDGQRESQKRVANSRSPTLTNFARK